MNLLAFSLVSFNTINSWLEAGGYAVLFGLLFACGLGLPLPEDIPLMISGALIARGDMQFVPTAIAAWCGIIGGDICLYHLGKKFGLEITRVRFVGKHLTEGRIKRIEVMFKKYGAFVVGFGRLFAGIRGAMVVAAGATRYNLVKFLLADSVAAVFSGGLFLFIGHLVGTHLNEQFVHQVGHYVIAGTAILVIAILGWILWRKRRAEERVETVAAKADKVVERVAQATHIKSASPPK